MDDVIFDSYCDCWVWFDWWDYLGFKFQYGIYRLVIIISAFLHRHQKSRKFETEIEKLGVK
jgi:hypothetical protein